MPTLLFQQLRYFRVSRCNRDINGSFAFLIPERSIGSGVQERLDDIDSTFVRSDHKRVVSEVVPYVRSYAPLQQPINDLGHTGFGRQYKRCISRQSARLEICLFSN